MNEDIERLKKKVIAHLGGDERAWDVWLDTPDNLAVGNATPRQQIEQGFAAQLEDWIDNITGPGPCYG